MKTLNILSSSIISSLIKNIPVSKGELYSFVNKDIIFPVQEKSNLPFAVIDFFCQSMILYTQELLSVEDKNKLLYILEMFDVFNKLNIKNNKESIEKALIRDFILYKDTKGFLVPYYEFRNVPKKETTGKLFHIINEHSWILKEGITQQVMMVPPAIWKNISFSEIPRKKQYQLRSDDKLVRTKLCFVYEMMKAKGDFISATHILEKQFKSTVHSKWTGYLSSFWYFFISQKEVLPLIEESFSSVVGYLVKRSNRIDNSITDNHKKVTKIIARLITQNKLNHEEINTIVQDALKIVK